MKPACMDDREFVRWNELNESITAVGSRASSPCQDCRLDWAREMRDVGRCDGRPGRSGPSVTPEDGRIPTVEELHAAGIHHPRSSAIIAAATRKHIAAGRRERAVELYNSGMSQVAVARQMGLSQAAISKYVRSARGRAA